jgi:multisubunit Na+/H+ antiporter MnhB subunit
MRGLNCLARGATQLGFVDILTAAILLGILLYAATLQFSVYNRPPTQAIAVGAATSK